jgi:hypothetical protein
VGRVDGHSHRLPRLRGHDRARHGDRQDRHDQRPRHLHVAHLHGRRLQQRGRVRQERLGQRLHHRLHPADGRARRAVPVPGLGSGNKLGPNCSTPQALAGAYQQVINTYGLKAIDIDIENSDEFENDTVRNRILDALKIVKQNNPGIQTIITFGTTTTGPNYYGNLLIERAAAIGANIDVFTIMPFDFGGSNLATDTINASEGLKNKLKSSFGWTDAQAYSHMGISGMNGLSDQQELTSVAAWTQIRDWAKSHGLGRLAFWSVNRDRPCPGGGVVSNCSGIAQNNWDFTRITAGF